MQLQDIEREFVRGDKSFNSDKRLGLWRRYCWVLVYFEQEYFLPRGRPSMHIQRKKWVLVVEKTCIISVDSCSL